ncbi:MAG TPA: gfo/Idh/MocA family oxidoreductase, partial [Clostridiales bacterium]|nr:gfo/Idh/MocA family oxidoreductase [Clostridiales bacterium]
REKLLDNHPSPDFLNGTALLENGVRLYFECGYLSEMHPDNGFWMDDRLAVHGTHGYAWAECDGGWAAFTKATQGEMISGRDPGWGQQQEGLQTPYTKDLADWLDDDSQVHPCNIDISCHGFEVLEGMCLSALDHTRVDFPIASLDYEDVLKRMDRVFPAAGKSVWS